MTDGGPSVMWFGNNTSMPESNSTWRVNQKAMSQCCYLRLVDEMYRRGEAKEALMNDGDVLKCGKCPTEMICDPSLNDGRLRWRVK